MKNLIILLPIMFLVGCQTAIPLIPKFPDAPIELMEAPAKLELLPEQTTLSDLMITVNKNYTTYHEESKRLIAWQEWYKEHRHLFEEASKQIGIK